MLKRSVLTLLLSSLAAAAPAHQLWIERDAAGPARVYVGDVDDAPDRGEAVAKLAATTRVFHADAVQPLALTARDDHLEVAAAGAGDLRLSNDQVWKPWKTRDGVVKAAVFNAREGRRETRAALPFEFVPAAAGGNTFTLVFQGRPVAAAKVTVVAPGQWAKRFVTDAQGRIDVPVASAGRYVLIAGHSVDEAREIAGQAVAKVDYTATLSFVAP